MRIVPVSTFTTEFQTLFPSLILPHCQQWANLTYRGTGRWNLRNGTTPDSFAQDPSFLHQADGFGGDVEVRLRYRPSPHWDLSLGWMGTWLQAKNGTDTTYFADGSQATIGLLDVKSQSNFYSFGIGYLF